ncbi:hypothetical protein V6Z12_D01G040300 [Gossypium hirsutum]
MKIKSCCDNLASCGEVISEHEHVTSILNGLPPEYESVISIVTASQVPYTVVSSDISSSANLVSHQPSESVNSNDSMLAYRPSNATRRRVRGRYSNSKIQCQLCGKPGHLVDRCYHRFDSTYKSNNYRPPPQVNMCVAGPPVTTWPPFSQSPPGCFSQQVSTPVSGATQPQAYLATPETVADNSWYSDSGATHHLTNSVTSIGDSGAYKGPGKVFVGNGSALPVMSTGQSSLLTRSRPLFMKSLLLVPGITKNLLSVSKFAKDNQVMVEFFPTQCQVRDLRTREVLLRGSEHQGLYRLHLNKSIAAPVSSTSAQCFTTTMKLPLSVWHSRLGHPCQAVLIKALACCNIQAADINKMVDCIACHLGKERKLPFVKSSTVYTAPLQLVVADFSKEFSIASPVHTRLLKMDLLNASIDRWLKQACLCWLMPPCH